MATIDPRFIQATILQHLFRDKDSGLPLSDGEIWFYRDTDRITLKSVFKYSGTPTPDFTELPNPLPLTNIGSASDGSNNDIIFYYFPEDEDGEIDRYFIEVWSSPGKLGGGVLQFTREAQPTVAEEEVTDENFVNFVANGQFLIHRDLPNSGEIADSETDIAYGGWTFERPGSSTATDFITFERFGSFIENPEANPRYSLRVRTTIPDASDTFKDVRYKIKDVNFFASDTEFLTWQMEAESNTGGPLLVELLAIKNFGTGGSATTELPITTFTIEPGFQKFIVSFVLGKNDSATIGSLDDDFLQFALRFPTGLVNDIDITNVILRDGEFSDLNYPDQSYAQQQEQTLGGSLPLPAYDGSDFGKTVVVTDAGYIYEGKQLTKGVITGCLVENEGADTDHDIQFDTGSAHSAIDPDIIITLGTPIIKQIDATWVEGTNQGGLFFGSVAADTTYHLFLILSDDFKTVDAGFDTSPGAVNIPSGFTHYVRVASLKTDSSSNLYQFVQRAQAPDLFLLDVQIQFVTGAAFNGTSVLHDTTAPEGVELWAKIRVQANNTNSVNQPSLLITSTFQDDTTVSSSNRSFQVFRNSAGGATGRALIEIDRLTNSDAEIRVNSDNSVDSDYNMALVSWFDTRGKV